MFTKLKKKIAEEAAITPRPGGAARIPRSVSKESITSAGADSGDDFVSQTLCLLIYVCSGFFHNRLASATQERICSA